MFEGEIVDDEHSSYNEDDYSDEMDDDEMEMEEEMDDEGDSEISVEEDEEAKVMDVCDCFPLAHTWIGANSI